MNYLLQHLKPLRKQKNSSFYLNVLQTDFCFERCIFCNLLIDVGYLTQLTFLNLKNGEILNERFYSYYCSLYLPYRPVEISIYPFLESSESLFLRIPFYVYLKH